MTGEIRYQIRPTRSSIGNGAALRSVRPRQWLLSPHDISGAFRNGCVSNLIVQALRHFAIMDEAIGARKDIGSDPDERVILTGHDDRPRIEA